MHEFVPAGHALLERRRILRVRTSRVIEAAPEDVWAVVSDHRTWTDWQADYKEHYPTTDQDQGLGARFHTTEWILRSESEITHWVPGRSIGLTVMRSKAWRWLFRSYYSEIDVEPVAGQSDRARVHYGVAFTGTVAFWLLAAYTVAYSMVSIRWDASSSLQSLDRLVADGDSE